ncbi:hypothetical protein PC9H_007818 [Pleurotus ostreatus]|uniref:Uncharacterized protein n=1 Tax=Pleurotus ostreatus TaxID=5322 RepID=A0A8H6ZUM5_PLEOS|nr:uncharacterized protein PC9H_007818 [Pleurotus ostreatus]KAF7428591.1 hypothetical protein PC9H_007818 [Pleurotus ostreatus]KAJ8696762.1 hypothetical protein PTI98_006605 [Pleurotus ostreatus]
MLPQYDPRIRCRKPWKGSWQNFKPVLEHPCPQSLKTPPSKNSFASRDFSGTYLVLYLTPDGQAKCTHFCLGPQIRITKISTKISRQFLAGPPALPAMESYDSVDDGDNGMLRELAIEIEDDDFELDSEINLNAPVLRALLRGEATPAAQSASQPPAAKTCASITVEEAWKF